MVRFHRRRFEVSPISFTPLCLSLSEETLKAVGPNSSLEYNYLRLETIVCEGRGDITLRLAVCVMFVITIAPRYYADSDITRSVVDPIFLPPGNAKWACLNVLRTALTILKKH